MGRKGAAGELHEEIGTPAVPQYHSVASIFAAASELLSLNTNSNTEGAEISQTKLQSSGTCDVVDVHGDTSHSNEKWEKVSPRNGSGSVDEFLHEKQMRPPARQTAEPKNPRGIVEKGKLPVVRKHELQQPIVQKVAVPVNDVLFEALPSDARRFLPTHGITTPEEFLETNVPTIAKALMNWRIKNRSDLSDSFISAQYCIYKWKSKLRDHLASQEASQAVTATTTPKTACLNQSPGSLDEELSNLNSLAQQFLPSQGITTAKAFLATGTKATAEALMQWRTKSEPCGCSIKDCREAILGWKRDLYERRHNHSGHELRKVDADLNHLSFMARGFLSSQGIANAAAFRSTEADTLTNALGRWREREKMLPLALGAARTMILKWKKESQPVEPSKSRQTKPSELQKRKLSKAQQTKPTESQTRELSESKKRKLSESQKQQNSSISPGERQPKAKPSESQKRKLSESKKSTPSDSKKRKLSESQKQQHISMTPGERQPKALLDGLDQAFEILSTPVQAFFVEQSILTPALLLQRDRQELARAFVEWRDRNGTRELKLGTAMSYVSEWRQISFAKVEAVPSCPNGVTTLAARNKAFPSKGAQLSEGDDSVMRPGFGTGMESRSTQGRRASSHEDTAAIRIDPDNGKQKKRPPTEEFPDTTAEKPIPQVRVQPERNISDTGTVQTTLPLQADAWAQAHVQPAYNASATVSSKDDESGTTAMDKRSACGQPSNAASRDAPGEPHELSNDGNCYLSFLERDAIRFLASRGITTSKSLLETNSKELANTLMEARRGSTTFSSSYSSSYQHVYRWKRIVRQRQAADRDQLSLNILPVADQKLLTSVGITTANAFLNMKPTTLAHALIESRQQLNMKPWAFSTARQVIYRWIAVVRPKESIPIPSRELLAEEPEERPVELDPVFKNLSPSDQWFLFTQSIMTAHDILQVGTKELACHLAQWKREKTRRDFKMSSATIYVGRWKSLVRSHAEGTEMVASSLNADDTAGASTGSGQQGTTATTSTVESMMGAEFSGTVDQQRSYVDCVSDNTDESLGTTNASAKSLHDSTYSPCESFTATKIAIYHAETRKDKMNDVLDRKAPTDSVGNGQSELRTNGEMRRKVTKRPCVQLPTATASVDEREDSSIYYSHNDGVIQDVTSLAGTEHAECAGSWADRKRSQTKNSPNDFKSGTGISSIAPFVTNMKTFSYW
jgi:hypothetical protein